MTTGFNKVHVWMTYNGRRIIDLDVHSMELLQFETLTAIWTYHGYDVVKQNQPELEKFCDDLMHGDDGNGWIDWAKKFRIIRKRTKQEKHQHDGQLQERMQYYRQSVA